MAFRSSRARSRHALLGAGSSRRQRTFPSPSGRSTVQPGDYALADRSAVIFISAEHIDRVLDAADDIVTREAAMSKALLAGAPVSEVMSGKYEHMIEDRQK